MNNTNNKVTCKSATAMFVWPLIVKAKYQIIKSGLHAKFESVYKHQHYIYRPWLFLAFDRKGYETNHQWWPISKV